MTKLHELASLIRSKNAGPFQLTIDIMFDDRATFERVLASGALSAERFATLYRLPVADIRIIPYEAAFAIKATFPRPVVSGDLADGDLMGGQLYGPLADLQIDDPTSDA
jgi:Domain of unknown function (DUF4387)